MVKILNQNQHEAQYILFETATGYSLFERIQGEEIGQTLPQVQAAAQDLSKFGKYIKLTAFHPFKSAADALENANDVSEGIVNDTLKNFLEMNLPKHKGLGVLDKTLAGSINKVCGIDCVCDENVGEIIRGLRLFDCKLLRQVLPGDLDRARLGLGHSYSRAKVKFNVHKSDNMIIQAIALLDTLDKDVNTFTMRVKEWYSWHFPELTRIVADGALYCQLAVAIGDKSTIGDDSVDSLEAIAPGMAQQIIDAARASMGTEINALDLLNIKHFAQRVASLSSYRKQLSEYLHSKMDVVAPNLAALVGDIVGARLISHAGSLTSLSKYPASTVQILGAEKALFRALKTRGNTPKYGLLYHAASVGKAGVKNKGRISRYLANKCSIASRIDCFSDVATRKFGEAMKLQVEERINFYESGAIPQKNVDVMSLVMKEIDEEMKIEEIEEKSEKSKRTNEEDGEKKKKKKKKESVQENDKKKKKESVEEDDKKKKKESVEEDDKKKNKQETEDKKDKKNKKKKSKSSE